MLKLVDEEVVLKISEEVVLKHVDEEVWLKIIDKVVLKLVDEEVELRNHRGNGVKICLCTGGVKINHRGGGIKSYR